MLMADRFRIGLLGSSRRLTTMSGAALLVVASREGGGVSPAYAGLSSVKGECREMHLVQVCVAFRGDCSATDLPAHALGADAEDLGACHGAVGVSTEGNQLVKN